MTMSKEIILGLLIPLIGTAAGSMSVFFMKKEMDSKVQKALTGFASGVMTAASIWSLLIPAMDQSFHLGRWAFLPAVAGFWLGILFLLFLDTVIPHLHMNSDEAEGPRSTLHKTTMMLLAVTLHNIPEGMAVGVIYAAYLSGSANISYGGALALAIGIAIQNFPEGAIISMPLHANGESRMKSFLGGVLSGAVEPLFGFLTIVASKAIVPILSYTLSLAAGAMIYVVVEELIPEMSSGEHSNIGVFMFSLGFTLMMVLDVALG